MIQTIQAKLKRTARKYKWRNPRGENDMTSDEAAVFLGVERVTLRRWREQGRGPKYTILTRSGRQRASYRRDDLLDFRNNTVEGGGDVWKPGGWRGSNKVQWRDPPAPDFND